MKKGNRYVVTHARRWYAAYAEKFGRLSNIFSFAWIGANECFHSYDQIAFLVIFPGL